MQEDIRIFDAYLEIITRVSIYDIPELQGKIHPVLGDKNDSANEEELFEYSPFYEVGTYDRTAAKNYAHTYVASRNPVYDYYEGLNNCTNFMSQILYAG